MIVENIRESFQILNVTSYKNKRGWFVKTADNERRCFLRVSMLESPEGSNWTKMHSVADVTLEYPWNTLCEYQALCVIWWRHQIETFSELLALCEGNSSVIGEFPSQRPVTRSFDVFFDFHLNKRLRKQSRRRRFETQSRSLWRHCYVAVITVDSCVPLWLTWINFNPSMDK